MIFSSRDKKILAPIAGSSLVLLLWIIPTIAEQRAVASWGGWFYCGYHPPFIYNGWYWVVYFYCDNYYLNGTGGWIEESIQEQIWYRFIGNWVYDHTYGPYITYYCSPSHYPVNCGTV